MPWQTRSMDQRNDFVQRARSGQQTISALCRHFGISRKTGYKWLERYRSEGVSGLADRSRRPHSVAQVAPEMQDLVIQTRREHPTWGARKIYDYLHNVRSMKDLPCSSSIHSCLVRAGGLVAPQRKRTRLGQLTTQMPVVTAPNEVWPIDFKGDFLLCNGTRCYPLTVTDWATRFVLSCQAFDRICGDQVRAALTVAFQTYGLPRYILSDNGSPFAGPGAGGLSTLSVWLIKLGIDVIRSRPGKPQDNGRHERMHRTLKADTVPFPASAVDQQQVAFDVFVDVFNHIRPHESLDGFPPGTLYIPSERPYHEPEDPVYPGHWETRRITTSGEFCFKGATYFLSQPLAGEHIGLYEYEDGQWRIAFGQTPIGSINAKTNTLTRLAAKRIGKTTATS